MNDINKINCESMKFSKEIGKLFIKKCEELEEKLKNNNNLTPEDKNSFYIYADYFNTLPCLIIDEEEQPKALYTPKYKINIEW